MCWVLDISDILKYDLGLNKHLDEEMHQPGISYKSHETTIFCNFKAMVL